jgi:hypothetical protein
MVPFGNFTATGGKFAPHGCQYPHQCRFSMPLWIPDDGDQDSETMSIKITK